MKKILLLSAGLIASVHAGASCELSPPQPLDTATQFYVSEKASTYTAPTWQADKIYTEGELVEYNGEFFEARWWSQNELPSEEWNSWHRAPNGDPSWIEDRSYYQHETALYDNAVWQAQHWILADQPNTSIAWQLDETAESFRTMQFSKSGESCVNREEEFIEIADGIYDSMYVVTTQSVDVLRFDTIQADRLPAHRWAKYVEGKLTAQGELAARIDGQYCKDNASCNALLVGQKADILFSSITYSSSKRISYDNAPYPMPDLTPPLEAYVEICNQDNYCRRHFYTQY